MSNINDERKINERYKMMTEQPVKRLILKMAIPTIISMLVTTIYNMVDSFYVGHLSTEAVAGVGVSFAYMAFINACGFFSGMVRATTFRVPWVPNRDRMQDAWPPRDSSRH